MPLSPLEKGSQIVDLRNAALLYKSKFLSLEESLYDNW